MDVISIITMSDKQKKKFTSKTNKKSLGKTNRNNSKSINVKNKKKVKEVWKPFPVPYQKFKDQYEISNMGNVRNRSTGKILSTSLRSNYKSIIIKIDGSITSIKIHRLVAFAFVPNDDPKEKVQVNHKNGDKLDNKVTNLEWVSKSENALHAEKTGLRAAPEKAVIRTDPETGKEVTFKSAQEACDQTGLDRTSIFKALNNNRKLVGGYSWRYVDKNNAKRFEIDTSEYKQLVGFPRYLLNAEGKLYNTESQKFLNPSQHTGDGGYQYYVYCPPDKRATLLIHKLVASYFLKRTDKTHNSVHHIDGDKSNNDVSNLKWCYVGGCPEPVLHFKRSYYDPKTADPIIKPERNQNKNLLTANPRNLSDNQLARREKMLEDLKTEKLKAKQKSKKVPKSKIVTDTDEEIVDEIEVYKAPKKKIQSKKKSKEEDPKSAKPVKAKKSNKKVVIESDEESDEESDDTEEHLKPKKPRDDIEVIEI